MIVASLDCIVEIPQGSAIGFIVDKSDPLFLMDIPNEILHLLIGVIGRAVIDIDDAVVVIFLIEDGTQVVFAIGAVVVRGDDNDERFILDNLRRRVLFMAFKSIHALADEHKEGCKREKGKNGFDCLFHKNGLKS